MFAILIITNEPIRLKKPRYPLYVLNTDQQIEHPQANKVYYKKWTNNYSESRNYLLDCVPIYDYYIILNSKDTMVKIPIEIVKFLRNNKPNALALKILVNDEFFNYDTRIIKFGTRYVGSVREKISGPIIKFETDEPVIFSDHIFKVRQNERFPYHIANKILNTEPFDINEFKKELEKTYDEEKFILLISLAKKLEDKSYIEQAAQYKKRAKEAYYYLFLLTETEHHLKKFMQADEMECDMIISKKTLQGIDELKLLLIK